MLYARDVPVDAAVLLGVARAPAECSTCRDMPRISRVTRASRTRACEVMRTRTPCTRARETNSQHEHCCSISESITLRSCPHLRFTAHLFNMRPRSESTLERPCVLGDIRVSLADVGAGVEALYAQALSRALQRGQRARRNVAGAMRALHATTPQPFSRAPFAKIQSPGWGQGSGGPSVGATSSADVESAAALRGPIHPAPRISSKKLAESAVFEVRLQVSVVQRGTYVCAQ